MEKKKIELNKNGIVELSDIEASQIKGGNIIWNIIKYVFKPLEAGRGSTIEPMPEFDDNSYDYGYFPDLESSTTCVSDNA